MFVSSGITGAAPQDITFKATPKSLDLYLAYDLGQCLNAFRTSLGLDVVVARVLPELPAPRFAMLEVVGSDLDFETPAGEITVDIHIGKLRAATDSGTDIGAESAIYSVERIINLLTENNHFGNLGGISHLRSISYVAGARYLPPFAIKEEHGDQFDGAMISVTFAYGQPLSAAL